MYGFKAFIITSWVYNNHHCYVERDEKHLEEKYLDQIMRNPRSCLASSRASLKLNTYSVNRDLECSDITKEINNSNPTFPPHNRHWLCHC